jgi:hypothetical protein
MPRNQGKMKLLKFKVKQFPSLVASVSLQDITNFSINFFLQSKIKSIKSRIFLHSIYQKPLSASIDYFCSQTFRSFYDVNFQIEDLTSNRKKAQAISIIKQDEVSKIFSKKRWKLIFLHSNHPWNVALPPQFKFQYPFARQISFRCAWMFNERKMDF